MVSDYYFIQSFTLLNIFKSTAFLFLFSVLSQPAKADDVDEFIQRHHVSTFDCPDDTFIPQLDEYLKKDSITVSQRTNLKVHKAHWLICVGKFDDAQVMLENLLSETQIDKNSMSYASIHYQLGFIFDVQDKPGKCDYYRQAERLAENKFNDIYLSSQLGLITVCDQEKQDIGVKLGRLFALLKSYSDKNDQASVAHIHNNIGLMYSSIGQMALAAEQYDKTYNLGLTVYEEKNQLAPLISLITAYSGSGDYENAKLMIDELYKRNLKVNTPLTNSWYHFAQSRQAYRTNDFEALRKSLRSWEVFLKQTSNGTMQITYDWFTAAMCLYDQDKDCVQAFVQEQSDINSSIPHRLSRHTHYIRFLVKAHLFLGDIEAANRSFDHYSTLTLEKVKTQQSSARVLSSAHLNNEIIGLENSLAAAEQRRIRSILMGFLVVVALLGLIYLVVGRKYLYKLTTDPLTGLSNEQSVVGQIKKVKTPEAGKVNALALFDINNFTAINAEFGYAAGEEALKQVSECLKQVTREQDIVGRVGADQFIVCLKSIDEDVANEFFTRIQTALTNVYYEAGTGEKVEVKSSMHLYSTSNDFSDVSDVLSEVRSVLRKS
jgi:diguanylate cyclase (GGDEF)-like protein